MSIPSKCSKCGLTFTSRAVDIRNSKNFSLGSVIEDCPRCGGLAHGQPGTYDFVGDVITAFRAPGVTKQEIYRFKDVAERVQSGELNSKEAAAEIASLGAPFAKLWKGANANAGAISIILMIVALYLQFTDGRASSAASQQQLEATLEQTQEIQTAEQVQRLILRELQKQTAAVEKPVVVSKRTPKSHKRTHPKKLSSKEWATKRQQWRMERLTRERWRRSHRPR